MLNEIYEIMTIDGHKFNSGIVCNGHVTLHKLHKFRKTQKGRSMVDKHSAYNTLYDYYFLINFIGGMCSVVVGTKKSCVCIFHSTSAKLQGGNTFPFPQKSSCIKDIFGVWVYAFTTMSNVISNLYHWLVLPYNMTFSFWNMLWFSSIQINIFNLQHANME